MNGPLGIYFALILILLIAVAIGTILTQTTWLKDLVQKIEDNNVIPDNVQAEIDGINKTIRGFSLWVLIALMIVLVIIILKFFVVFKCQLFYTDKETDESWDIFIVWKINSGLVWAAGPYL